MNEVIQPLRFHTSEAYKMINRHTLLNYFNFVPLIVDRSLLTPFQVDCDYVASTPEYDPLTTAELINFRTGEVTNLLPYLTFVHYVDSLSNSTRLYIQFWGASTLPAIKYGVYYLHLANTTEEWWSDQFKTGHYNTVKIEYSNTVSFAGIPVSDRAFMSAMYEGRSFDSGEYLEHSEANKDKDNFDIFTYRRSDKLRNLILRGDSNVIDVCKLAQMCTTVYITDETGKRSLVEITEISPEPVSHSNYVNVILKYRVKANSIISVNLTPSKRLFTQLPTGTPDPVNIGETFDGEYETFDGQTQTFNNQ
jgi:hypothetical protein